jgi:hypothetical protein
MHAAVDVDTLLYSPLLSAVSRAHWGKRRAIGRPAHRMTRA